MKLLSNEDDLHTRLCRFLLTYRTTPNASGKSPAELLLNRQPRTRYDLLHPSNLKQEVKSFEQNLDHTPKFALGDAVYALNFSRHGATWVPGEITCVQSPMNYTVQVDDAAWKRHRDQLRPRTIPRSMLPEMAAPETTAPAPAMTVPETATPSPISTPTPIPASVPASLPPVQAPPTVPVQHPVASSAATPPVPATRPHRAVLPPIRFRDG